MFYYVEFLRAARALRIVGIILGLMFIAGVIARVSIGGSFVVDDVATALERSPTAHVTRTQLPNGDTHVVVDDPKKNVHAVIDHHGGSATVSVVEMRGAGARGPRHETVTRVFSSSDTSHALRSGVSGVNFFWEGLLWATIPLGLLVATLLAGPLAKENHGHLELAWTKPVSRERYALAAGAVDAGAIVLAQVAAVVMALLVAVMWGIPRIGFEPGGVVKIGIALVAPIAWYACLTALSASMKRGPGAVLGIGWVVAIVAPVIAGGTENASWAVARMIHVVSAALSYIDPLTYVWFQGADSVAALARAESKALVVLAAMAVVYLALAVVQWRRVEA